MCFLDFKFIVYWHIIFLCCKTLLFCLSFADEDILTLFLSFQVADIAVRYHTCDNSSHLSWDKTFTSHSRCCQSVVLPDSSTRVCEVCLSFSRPTFTTSPLHCLFPPLTQGGDVFQTYLRRCCLHQLPSSTSINSATSMGCSNFLDSYSPFSQYSACCRKVEPQLNESQAKEEPEMQSVPPPPPPSLIAPSSVPQLEGDGITGLRCQTNRTLRFYVLDLALNWPLAVRLGASGNRSCLHQESGAQGDGSGDGSFAAIVNLKDEVHYVLQRSPAATLTESLGKAWTGCVTGWFCLLFLKLEARPTWKF